MYVLSYLRVSSKGQIDGDGYPRQREAISKFCAQHNLLLEAEFCELGVSGSVESTDRPAFSDLLYKVEEIQQRDIRPMAIVVERMDRLARDLMVSEVLLSQCRKRGLQVFAVDRGLVDIATNSGDPTHKLIRQVMAAVAEFEKSTLVNKLRVARERAKTKRGGFKPYGSNQEEAIILDLMKSLFKGGVSYRGIAMHLNDSNLKTRTGKPWHHEVVFRILKRSKPPTESNL